METPRITLLDKKRILHLSSFIFYSALVFHDMGGASHATPAKAARPISIILFEEEAIVMVSSRSGN